MAEFCHWLHQEVHKLSSAAERKPVRLVKSQQETTKKQVCTELEAAERQCPGVLYFHKSLLQTSHTGTKKQPSGEKLCGHMNHKLPGMLPTLCWQHAWAQQVRPSPTGEA